MRVKKFLGGGLCAKLAKHCIKGQLRRPESLLQSTSYTVPSLQFFNQFGFDKPKWDLIGTTMIEHSFFRSAGIY